MNKELKIKTKKKFISVKINLYLLLEYYLLIFFLYWKHFFILHKYDK